MSEELYTLYQEDMDFKGYVDRWAKNHDLSIFEVFRFKILKEYAKWLKENKSDKVSEPAAPVSCDIAERK
jgi:hypothetical protein